MDKKWPICEYLKPVAGSFLQLFGIWGNNWAHIIVGTISVAVALMAGIKKLKKPAA